jgi:hypothetical protein
MKRVSLWLFAIIAMLCVGPAPIGATDDDDVDVQLVLAVDVSRSIDDQEYDLQKRGYAEALLHPAVIDSILQGRRRAIAITYIEWSGSDAQKVLVPWTVVRDGESAELFSGLLLASQRAFNGWTSISGAIDFSVAQFDHSPYKSARRVIDVSGDGTNNSGRPAAAARDDALAKGMIINGLVIMNEQPPKGSFRGGEPPLDEFYRNDVIGGPGAFLIAIDDFTSFAHAIRNKLIREIADIRKPIQYADARLLLARPHR